MPKRARSKPKALKSSTLRQTEADNLQAEEPEKKYSQPKSSNFIQEFAQRADSNNFSKKQSSPRNKLNSDLNDSTVSYEESPVPDQPSQMIKLKVTLKSRF